MRILSLSVLSLLLSAPAFAADLGTYRPGTPYHSTIVPGADVCESQCAGDARCRGWNYVKAVPSAPGVCEFQSSVGQPISSAVSISGISPSAMPMPNRVVAGDTNTVRVGTAVTPQTQERRIIREPVPGPNVMHRVATHRAPAHHGLQPMLDNSARIAAPSARPVQQQPRGRARSAPQSQQFRMQPQRPVSQGRPPIGQPIPAPQTYQPQSVQPHAQRPVGSQQPHHGAIAPQALQPMPRASVSNPVTFQQTPSANPSLYGHLNDDVPVNATPVSPGYARPVAPVQQTQLAGARR